MSFEINLKIEQTGSGKEELTTIINDSMYKISISYLDCRFKGNLIEVEPISMINYPYPLDISKIYITFAKL